MANFPLVHKSDLRLGSRGNGNSLSLPGGAEPRRNGLAAPLRLPQRIFANRSLSGFPRRSGVARTFGTINGLTAKRPAKAAPIGDEMERLRIHPRSRESAQGMLAALAGFHAELLESAEGYEIVVTLGMDGWGDHEIVALLNALEQYVTACANGPARLELGGRSYVMRPKEG